MIKANFDNKIINFNRKITLNKIKNLEVPKKLDSLMTKHYIFFLDKMYFTSNSRSQKSFIYQPTLDTLEFKKKTNILIMFLVGNEREYIN